MIRRSGTVSVRVLLLAVLVLLAATVFDAPAQAASPAWRLLGVTGPTNLPPGGNGEIMIYATNVGGDATNATTTLRIGPLPTGITTSGTPTGIGWFCAPTGVGQSNVTCTRTALVAAGGTSPTVAVPVTVGPLAEAHSDISLSIEGGGATEASDYLEPLTVSPEPAQPGIQAMWAGAFDENGRPAREAGGHPASAGAAILMKTVLSPSGQVVPAGNLRDAQVELPPGFIGNPTLTKRCPQYELTGTKSTICPSTAIVGLGEPSVESFQGGGGFGASGGAGQPVYNDDPAFGYAAEFTFPFVTAQQVLVGSLRSDGDYGVTITAPNVPEVYKTFGAFTMLQGNPAGAAGRPFLTNSTDCAEQAASAPLTTVKTNTWERSSIFDSSTVEIPSVTGCDQLDFEPSFSFRPSASQAASVTGATADLSMSQVGLLDPSKLASPQLKRSVVTLPIGLTLNPSAADGLQACSTQQIGLRGTGFPSPNPIRFDQIHPSCPDASMIGTAEIQTPLLDETLQGTVYLAAQEDNPFHSLIAMYLIVDDAKTGVVAKLPGKVEPDPHTGQLTAVFDDNPQLPVSDLKLNFRGGGPRSTLTTPDVCGRYTTSGEWTPWSAPESGPPASTADSFDVSGGVGGSVCPTSKTDRPFAPTLAAGVTDATAGKHSLFTLRLTRPDGNQELEKVSVTTPPGFAASFKGVTTCPAAAIAAAEAPGRTGAQELAHSSCPASSQVGTTTVAAGVGSSPIYVKTGRVYLTGPYKGAPLSFTFIVPAVAGPFDLGVQVVKAAINVNPKTAQVTAVSDSVPQILKGIPLLIREIQVNLDRSDFTLNPTSCEPMSIGAQVMGASGAVANLSNRFQVGNCSALAFKPNLKIQLHGGTKRGDYQRLSATVTYPEGPGYANIARAAVTLPHSEFLAQEHIRAVCTRVQFAAHECPKASIYGHATAITPLLEDPLTGPVYLRSSDNLLPDLVAALRGPESMPIAVELDGRTDSKNGGIRNTFEAVPDAPISKFTLQLQGGKKSLIVNSRGLCNGTQRAMVRLDAQNGKRRNFRSVVGNDCGKGMRRNKRHGRPLTKRTLRSILSELENRLAL